MKCGCHIRVPKYDKTKSGCHIRVPEYDIRIFYVGFNNLFEANITYAEVLLTK